MESILNNIYELVDLIIKADPAIYRVMFFDPSGSEIYQYAKMWNKGKKYTSVGAMIGQIFKNSDKFLNFMKLNPNQNFNFQWNFEDAIIYAVNSNYGYIAILCEKDVDLGFVKTVLLRQAMPKYVRIMGPIFE